MSQQINLFTAQFRKQVILLSADLMAAGAGVMLLLTLAASAWTYYSEQALRTEVGAITTRANAAQSRLETLLKEHDPELQAKALDGEISHQESALADKREVANVLKDGEFGDTKGYSDYLRAMARQIVDGVWIRSFDIAGSGRHFMIEGSTLRADLIPQYIKRLSAEPSMQGRQFAMLVLRPPKPSTGDGKDGDGTGGGTKDGDGANKGGTSAKPAKPYLDFHLSSELTKPAADGGASASDSDRYLNYAKAVQ